MKATQSLTCGLANGISLTQLQYTPDSTTPALSMPTRVHAQKPRRVIGLVLKRFSNRNSLMTCHA